MTRREIQAQLIEALRERSAFTVEADLESDLDEVRPYMDVPNFDSVVALEVCADIIDFIGGDQGSDAYDLLTDSFGVDEEGLDRTLEEVSERMFEWHN